MFDLQNSKKRMNIAYKSKDGHNSLTNHAERFHNKHLMIGNVDDNDTGSVRRGKKRSERDAGLLNSNVRGMLKKTHMSTKKLLDNDPRQVMLLLTCLQYSASINLLIFPQILFNELLVMLIVFARLSFSIVDNSWFRCLVWWLDPSITVPSRKVLMGKLLPSAKAAGSSSLKTILSVVHGICVTLDLWMSRKGEDVMSLDGHCITPEWEFFTFHIDLVNCSEGTSGESLAQQILPSFTAYGLEHKLYAYNKDQGGNLRTAAEAMANGEVFCKALGTLRPHETDCFAHAVNGACNGSVKKVKGTTFLTRACNVKDVMARFQKVVTFLKQSTVGTRHYIRVCSLFNYSAVKLVTAVRTRFTSYFTQLEAMLPRKEIWTRLFGREVDMDHRDKEPRLEDYDVGQKIHDVLSYPCTVVIKSQDKGHWLMSDAINRVARMYLEFEDKLQQLTQDVAAEAAARQAPDLTEAQKFDVDLKNVDKTMRQHILDHLEPFVEPVRSYDDKRAPVALSLMVDPRYCDGALFYLMCPHENGAPVTNQQRLAHHNELMRAYDERQLIPAMVAMQEHLHKLANPTEPQTSRPDPSQPTSSQTAQPAEATSEVPLNLLSQLIPDSGVNDSNDGEAYVLRQQRKDRATEELARFRRTFANRDKSVKPLAWWKENAAIYPILSEVARIILSCPGSQIECERIFSVCGQLISLLRSKMSIENLETVVFIMKNVDQLDTMKYVLSKRHGVQAAAAAMRDDKQLRPVSEMQHAFWANFDDMGNSTEDVEQEARRLDEQLREEVMRAFDSCSNVNSEGGTLPSTSGGSSGASMPDVVDVISDDDV